MNRKFKGLMTVASSAFAVSLVFAHVPSSDSDLFCSSLNSTHLDTSLPVSHPANRCALEKSAGVSWSSWLSGKTHGYQFHYLDLLELLSRRSDTTKSNTRPTSS